MNFELAYIPAILLTGMVYLFVFVGLWKNEIRKVYSRRTKREKILTVGVLVAAVVLTLFIAARQDAGLLPHRSSPVIPASRNIARRLQGIETPLFYKMRKERRRTIL